MFQQQLELAIREFGETWDFSFGETWIETDDPNARVRGYFCRVSACPTPTEKEPLKRYLYYTRRGKTLEEALSWAVIDIRANDEWAKFIAARVS